MKKSDAVWLEINTDSIFRTEEEIGVENLKDLDVPEKYKEKFIEMDKLYLEEENKNKVEEIK